MSMLDKCDSMRTSELRQSCKFKGFTGCHSLNRDELLELCVEYSSEHYIETLQREGWTYESSYRTGKKFLMDPTRVMIIGEKEEVLGIVGMSIDQMTELEYPDFLDTVYISLKNGVLAHRFINQSDTYYSTDKVSQCFKVLNTPVEIFAKSNYPVVLFDDELGCGVALYIKDDDEILIETTKERIEHVSKTMKLQELKSILHSYWNRRGKEYKGPLENKKDYVHAFVAEGQII